MLKLSFRTFQASIMKDSYVWIISEFRIIFNICGAMDSTNIFNVHAAGTEFYIIFYIKDQGFFFENRFSNVASKLGIFAEF